METHTADVIVVGCGIAGLSAAVSAAEAGATVHVLERAPRNDRGGNTRYTESFWRMKDHDTIADDFAERLAENAAGYLDPEVTKDYARPYAEWSPLLRAQPALDPALIEAWGDGAGPAVRWLESKGARFDYLPIYFLTVSTSRLAPVGGGWALVEALATWCETEGASQVTIHYETTAKGLIQDEAGRVVGVRAQGPGGRTEYRGRSVVLASGGFEGNAEMLARYCGPTAQWIRPIAKGGYFNRGEGIRMALDLGAAPGGDFGSFHAQPVDPRSGAIEAAVVTFNYGLLVNLDGDRFTDEAPATADACYEAITRDILTQKKGLAYVIHDGRLDDVPNWRLGVRSDQPPIEAETLEQLAARLGLDPDRLRASIDAYNAHCPPEPTGDAFRPLELDGLRTRPGLAPAKSNWARPLDRGPWRAWPIMCANCFTFGGLKVNPDAQVLDMDGRPLPGLYAAGETMGVYHRTYTGSTSVMRGCVFGRIAGHHAATARGRNTATPEP
ncbi:MAG: FAD-dependent oxidoreductase [Alphaproteobacteria bacterium]|nr:FAD-dependent oxidoreductase [Alphaproteobacteria bacterium]MCB9929495.1 FAD-dependent oxidoreductase [Alphaproteobacteria bacterium]